MVENMLEIGKIIKWMERENILGQMVKNTLESIYKIEGRDMANSSGQMEEVIKEIGRMENIMEKDYI
jgi:hypothetical protein